MPITKRTLLFPLTLALSLSFSSLSTYAAITDADRALAREIIEDAIRFRTAKGYGQVPAMAQMLASRLKAAGFTDDDIDMPAVEIDGETTVGLVVRYRGFGSDKAPIVLLAHMDVVDALPENWSTDPFQPVEKDGYLYGRGSTDNKAGMSLLVTSFIRLKQQGWEPSRDLVITFTGDEESGMVSTRMLTQHPWVRNAEFALNADAGIGSMKADGSDTSFSIQSAEKTFATFRVSASNPGGHSSQPRPDNAIYDLARALTAVQGLRFPVEFNEITRGMVEEIAAKNPGELANALRRLLDKPDDAAARAVAERYPAYSNVLWTTCVATMLQAGNAENALPQNASATVNCRIFPGTSVAQVQQTLAQAIGNDAIDITVLGEPVESPVSPVREDVFGALRKAVHANYPGAPVEPSMSSGGTDGREFRRAGIPTYGAGSLALVMPDDARAHGTDERLLLDSYYKEQLFWDVLLKEVAGQ
jgi:carboxypeptidase PM20D1